MGKDVALDRFEPARPGSSAPRSYTFVVAALGLGVAHLSIIALTIGLRAEHFVADAVLAVLALWGHRVTRMRSVFFALLPFWLTGVAYEGVRVLLPLRGPVHVADLHAADLALFGVQNAAGQLLTVPAALQQHTHAVIDALCGLAYIVYFLVPLALIPIWLWRKDALRAHRLAWAFLLVNLAGFATQIVWPAAPPWYVDSHGLGPAVLDAAPSAAGAARFDALFGISYFAAFYQRNVNVFGAMPSLHVAYPTLAAIACFSLGARWFVPAALFALLVAFSALYLNHHYVLDVVAGALYAGAAYAAVALLAQRLMPKLMRGAEMRKSR